MRVLAALYLLTLLGAPLLAAQPYWEAVPLPTPPTPDGTTCHSGVGPTGQMFGGAQGLVLSSACGTHRLGPGDRWTRLSDGEVIGLQEEPDGTLYARGVVDGDSPSNLFNGPYVLREGAWHPWRTGLPTDTSSEALLLDFAIGADGRAWASATADAATAGPRLYTRSPGADAWSVVPESSFPDDLSPVFLRRFRDGTIGGVRYDHDNTADPATLRSIVFYDHRDGAWSTKEVDVRAFGLPSSASSSGNGFESMYRGAVHVWASYDGGHTVVANDQGEAAPTPAIGGYVTGFGYDGGILFASRMGEATGVVLSTQIGLEWYDMEFAETPGAATSLAVDANGVVYAQELFATRLLRLVRGSLAAAPPPDAPDVSIRVAPNPVAGPATVWVETGGAADLTVEVFDVLGRRMHTLHTGPADRRLALRLPEALPPGPYFVSVHSGDGRSVRSFIRR